jgi:hypothetical protein
MIHTFNWATFLRRRGTPERYVSNYFSLTRLPADFPGDRRIYVASNGDDTTGTGTIALPYLTIAKAVTDLRDGYGDRVLLRCGDTFTDDLFPFSLSGHSMQRPMIFMSYGTGARPKINTNGNNFFQNAFETDIYHLWFMGLEVTNTPYDGTGTHYKGFVFTWHCEDILLEDCYVHNFNFGIDMEGHAHGGGPAFHSNMRIRACVIADIYNSDIEPVGDWQNCSGIFVSSVNGMLIEQCALVDCGYLSQDDGTTGKHGIYVHGECGNVTVVNNVQIGGDGFTIRCGGVIKGNFLGETMSVIQCGMGDVATVGGIRVTCENNVGISGMSYDALSASPASSAKPTIGYALGNIGFASSFSNNLCVNPIADPTAQDCRVFWFRTPADLLLGSELVVGAPLTFSNNIFMKAGVFYGQERADASYPAVTTFTGNDFQMSQDADFRMKSNNQVSTLMDWSGNNFYAETGNDPYDINGTPLDSPAWDALTGDATATHNSPGSMGYTNPAITLDDVAVHFGKGTTDGLKSALKRRSFNHWTDNLTANVLAAYVRSCFE